MSCGLPKYYYIFIYLKTRARHARAWSQNSSPFPTGFNVVDFLLNFFRVFQFTSPVTSIFFYIFGTGIMRGMKNYFFTFLSFCLFSGSKFSGFLKFTLFFNSQRRNERKLTQVLVQKFCILSADPGFYLFYNFRGRFLSFLGFSGTPNFSLFYPLFCHFL